MKRPSLPPALRKSAIYGAAGLTLAVVFWAYLDPHAVAALSSRLWSCVG